MLQKSTSRTIGESKPVSMPSDVATAIAAALSDNGRGIYQMNTGVIEKGSLPKSSSLTVVNSNNAGSAAQTVYMFNEDNFNTVATGGDLLTSKTYNDGFGGKLINQMLKVANNGRGLKAKGFNILFKDASGNQDSAALETANLTIQSYTGIGGKADPAVLDLSEALRNSQFQQGLLTIDCPFWVNAITQISVYVPKGYTMALNIFWE